MSDRLPSPTDTRTGLAVSGGVDSMALAQLCSGLKTCETTFDWNFRAYIVDHAARLGSKDEAECVAERLDRMG